MKRSAFAALAAAGVTLAVAAMISVAMAQGTAKWSSLVQDGQAPNEYTFISVLNTGSASHTVTVSFYSKAGSKITDTSSTVTAGAQWQLFTGSAGGVSATKGADGYAKVTTTGTLTELDVWSAVVLPNAGNYPGFTGVWTSH